MSVKTGQLHDDTSSYCSLLPLSDDMVLIAHSELNGPGPAGTPLKNIRVRTTKTTTR